MDAFAEDERDVAPSELLTIDIEGWEGPLDLLLALARTQKVDLMAISILDLAEQYIAYVEEARQLRLELAADYLVMAAWLAYLKSCLLLPRDPTADPSPEELALRLQLRLQRLDAMRESGARLVARDRIGRDIFLRGAPEGLRVDQARQWQCDWFELIAAYGQVRARTRPAMHVPRRRPVVTLEDALARVSILVGSAVEWTAIEAFLPDRLSPELQRSAVASTFLAALELAKQARVDLSQDAAFGPLMLRRRG